MLTMPMEPPPKMLRARTPGRLRTRRPDGLVDWAVPSLLRAIILPGFRFERGPEGAGGWSVVTLPWLLWLFAWPYAVSFQVLGWAVVLGVWIFVRVTLGSWNRLALPILLSEVYRRRQRKALKRGGTMEAEIARALPAAARTHATVRATQAGPIELPAPASHPPVDARPAAATPVRQPAAAASGLLEGVLVAGPDGSLQLVEPLPDGRSIVTPVEWT